MKLTIVLFSLLFPFYAWGQEADSVAVKNDSTAWDMDLKEVSVTASTERTEGDKTVVTFTKDMRRGMRNTAQLLGNLRNFTYDAMSNSIEYNNQKNIMVLVDSLEKGSDYVYNLHHHRFAKVEIIDRPTGKYQGYDVLVNLVTVENYEGYEGLLLANQRIMPTGVNSGKFIFLQ